MANGDNGDPNAAGPLAPTGTQVPSPQAAGSFDYAFGDSLAVQQINHHIGGMTAGMKDKQFLSADQPLTPGTFAGVGDTPSRVLDRLNAMLEKNPDMFRGKNIFLSPGTSNNASQMNEIKLILAKFRDAGAANVVVPGVGPGKPGDPINKAGGQAAVNKALENAVTGAGFTYYMPTLTHGWDSAQLIHPNNVPEMFNQASAALLQARTAQPTPAEPATDQPTGLQGPAGEYGPIVRNPLLVSPEPTGHPMTAPLQPDTSGLRVGMPAYGTPNVINPYAVRPEGAPPGGSPTNPAAVHVQQVIAALQKAGASPAFTQAALNQVYYEGGWRLPWFKSPGDENSFGHWQFNDRGELPGYMDWMNKNAQGQNYQDSGLQASYLASRVPQEVLTGDDPKKITDWLNNNFEAYLGHAAGQRYEHLSDAANLMQGNYASIGGGTGSSPYYGGDVVPGTNFGVGGQLAFAPPSAQAPTLTPGGGGGGTAGGGGPGPNPQLATPGMTPNPNIQATRDQLAKSLQQGQGWQKLALAMSFLKPNVAPVVNYNPSQVFQPQPVHFASNPVDDNIVSGGGGISSAYMRFRPESVPGYLFSMGG